MILVNLLTLVIFNTCVLVQSAEREDPCPVISRKEVENNNEDSKYVRSSEELSDTWVHKLGCSDHRIFIGPDGMHYCLQYTVKGEGDTLTCEKSTDTESRDLDTTRKPEPTKAIITTTNTPIITMPREQCHEEGDIVTKPSSEWVSQCPECGGGSQSPIDIPSTTIKEPYSDHRLTFKNYKHLNWSTIVRTEGKHTLNFDFITSSTTEVPSLTGEQLGSQNRYGFVQLHFHWSNTNEKGSEHQINGKKFPLEAHMSHILDDGSTINTADNADSSQPKLLMLGFLFEIDESHDVMEENDNIEFYSLLGEPELKRDPSDPNTEDHRKMSIYRLIKPAIFGDFYTYNGSMEIPPCYENVKWIVFKNKLKISNRQLSQIRYGLAHVDEKTFSNNREVQALNGREVIETTGASEVGQGPVIDEGEGVDTNMDTVPGAGENVEDILPEQGVLESLDTTMDTIPDEDVDEVPPEQGVPEGIDANMDTIPDEGVDDVPPEQSVPEGIDANMDTLPNVDGESPQDLPEGVSEGGEVQQVQRQNPSIGEELDPSQLARPLVTSK